jgi:phage terminase large subunit
MECSFTAPVLGTYFAGIVQKLEQNGQIAPKACAYDPTFPVSMVSDLGYTDSTALWFWQTRPDGVAIVDYYENQSRPLQHYFDVLDNKGYEYDKIWLPHDARAKTLQTGKSTVEQFLTKYGEQGLIDIVPSLSKQHGIDAARLVMPMCYFDLDTCSDGIEALRAYRRRYNEATKAFTNEPLHDWSSNGADSFRYLSLVCQDKLKVMPKYRTLDPTNAEYFKKATYNFNLNQLFEANEATNGLNLLKRRI